MDITIAYSATDLRPRDSEPGPMCFGLEIPYGHEYDDNGGKSMDPPIECAGCPCFKNEDCTKDNCMAWADGDLPRHISEDQDDIRYQEGSEVTEAAS